jgi:hypothetical protein
VIVLDRIDPADLDQLWPVLEPYIRSAIERGDAPTVPEAVLAKAAAGARFLWSVTQGDALLGVACSGVRRGKHGQTAFIEFVAGQGLHVWMDDALTAFEERARAAGMDAVETDESRMGWLPALRARGYRPVRVVVQKVFADG